MDKLVGFGFIIPTGSVRLSRDGQEGEGMDRRIGGIRIHNSDLGPQGTTTVDCHCGCDCVRLI